MGRGILGVQGVHDFPESFFFMLCADIGIFLNISDTAQMNF